MRKLIVILVLVSANLFAQELPEANRLVLEFAQKNVGKRVGNGVCRTLTNRALRHKDEVLRPQKKSIIDYTHGEIGKKISLEKALPGDIIIFTNCIIKFNDGKTYAPSHHIGIVKSAKNVTLTLYEQNAINEKDITLLKSKVIESSFDLENVYRGTITIIRPK